MYQTRNLFVTHYEEPTPEPTPEPSPNPEPKPEKSYNQTEVNGFVEKRVAKMKQENRQMLSKFEALQQSIQTDSEGREALETELDELRQRTLSQDEIQKREAKKASDKYSKDLDTAQKAAETWQGEYNDLRIKHEINSASAKNKVLPESYELVESFIQPHTKLVDLRDSDGNPTGELQSMVDFADHDDEGKSITVHMSVPDTIKRMSELPQKYGNLFEGQKIGGTGTSSGTNNTSGKLDPSKMSTEEYIAYRKENPQAALGIV